MTQVSAYIAGPMRGKSNFNFDRFDQVARHCVREYDWLVFNPAQHDREVYPDIHTWPGYATGDVDLCPDFDFASAMRWDLQKVAQSNHLVLLPGWEASHGARTERAVAEVTDSMIWLAHHGSGSGWYLVLDPVQVRMSPASMTTVNKPVRYEGEDLENLERDARNVGGTEIKTSATGGQKGAKAVELARIPQSALRAVAEHFNQGSQKYPDPAPGVANWTLGYDWSLCINALQRHLSAWQSGEDRDPEFNTSHLRAVAWHALVLLEFEIQGWGTDDRRTVAARGEHLAMQEKVVKLLENRGSYRSESEKGPHRCGDQVEHPTFGKGTVVWSGERQCDVGFRDKRRWIPTGELVKA